MPDTDRLSLLRALIDHPGTPESERDTARRLHGRLIAKNSARSGLTDEAHASYARTYGPKANEVPHHAPLSVITKLMRQDLRLARRTLSDDAGNSVALVDPIASAPEQIGFSVRKRPRGSSIDISILNVPADWFAPGAEVRGASGRAHYGYTQRLVDLIEAVEEIHYAYNWDGSDVMSDYFDHRYYGSVRVDRSHLR